MFSLHTISLGLKKDLLVGTQKSQLVSTATAFSGPESALLFVMGMGLSPQQKVCWGTREGKGREDEECMTGVKDLLQ